MVGDNNIDYNKIFNALEYYKSKGFEYIHLDWLVDEKISNITKPDICKNFFVNDTVLVASGEQSFIKLLIENKLSGRYVGITPCFRDENNIDYTHSEYFLKVELIDTNVSGNSLKEINLSLEFFNSYIKSEILLTGVDNYDIIDSNNRIELGSYGIREYDGMKWIYATGLAEPRLTRAILF